MTLTEDLRKQAKEFGFVSVGISTPQRLHDLPHGLVSDVPTLVAGVPFALVHILANALVFALAGPYVIRGLASAGHPRADGVPT